MLFSIFLILGGLPGGPSPSGIGADVQAYRFSIVLSDSTNRIQGLAGIQVRFTENETSFRLDLEKTMTVSAVTEGGRPVRYAQDASGVTLRVHADANSVHTYAVTYVGIPRDGLIISSNKFGHRTFFGDNWPDRAHCWLPCVDHPWNKAPVEFLVTAPAHYQVVAGGRKTEERDLPGGMHFTHWVEKVPLPTKVMVIGVADFAIQRLPDVGGIPLYTYVFPENKERGFHDYAVAARILPFYIRNIGPYAYEKLANVQSKTIFGGMENASAIFYFEGSVGNPGLERLMAHEIAHQWFGDAVTEGSYAHLWLSEGFATYMTHLYMEHTYGADSLKAGLRLDRNRIIAFTRYSSRPVVDVHRVGGYMALLDTNSYQKGSWVLHMLRREIGDSLFWRGIRLYFARYDGRNAHTQSFRRVMEEVSGINLETFFHQWIYSPGIPLLRLSIAGHMLKVEQAQSQPFSFPLEYTIGDDPRVFRVRIHRKITLIPLPPQTTGQIHADPGVNLLADIRVNP
jgi:aminopeptidase N